MSASLPATYKKAIATKASLDYRDSIRVVEVPLDPVPQPGHALVKVRYNGVNAGDTVYCAATFYNKGTAAPFDIGMEAMGEVVAIGEGVTNVAVGTPVMFTNFGLGYTEYRALPAAMLIPLPSLEAKWLALLLSGSTAWLALEHCPPKQGGVALVTAAAGAAGIFAVQLLKKKYQCTVVATASSERKADYLKSLGVDRVIDYKKENLSAVLTAEYPQGLDYVYDGVGGKMLETILLTHMAVLGKVLIIGSVSGYTNGFSQKEDAASQTTLTFNDMMPLLSKSVSIVYFFLVHFLPKFPEAMAGLFGMVLSGELVSPIDETERFVGLERVADAIAHLHAGRNIGKVVVAVGEGTK